MAPQIFLSALIGEKDGLKIGNDQIFLHILSKGISDG
jgi:hypothetical protein